MPPSSSTLCHQVSGPQRWVPFWIFAPFFKKSKDALLGFQNSCRFVLEAQDSKHATILIGIISNGATNFELIFFQVDSFLAFLDFLSYLENWLYYEKLFKILLCYII
jgi:hypothetical protein